MRLRSSILVAVIWAVSLAAMATWVRAQAQPHRAQKWTPLAEPTVLAGDDLGFRVEWMNDRVPTGQIVIRLKGQWVEARVGKPPNVTVVPAPPGAPPPPPAIPR